MKHTFAIVTASLATLALAGCGGGGTGGSAGSGGATVDNTFAGTTDTALSVTAVQFNNNASNRVVLANGTFNGTTDQATIGGNGLALDATSNVSSGLDYVAALVVGTSNQVVYVPTADIGTVPTTGTATFTGSADVEVSLASAGANNGVYAGDMTATTVANYGAVSTSTVTFTNLTNATLEQNGQVVAFTPSGSETVAITNLLGTARGLSNGASTAATITNFGSVNQSVGAAAANIELDAEYAGPNAEEIAGGVRIINSASDEVEAVFAGQR